MSRLLDAVLTTDAAQRPRLAQAALAMLVMAAGVAAMHYFVWAGVARGAAVSWWSGATMAGVGVFFALIRSGWSRRWREPALAVPQMLFALTSSAAAYALLGAGRGAVFPVVMVILMFGMFVATPRQMRGVSLYAVLLFGATMAWMTLRDPRAYPAAIEAGHFLLVGTMMPAVSLLAGRLSRMRERSRQQRAELAQALAHLRELTTRDELTGLVNRSRMQVVMERERQRCVRSGQTFCVAALDIDGLEPITADYGDAGRDAVLRAVAQEAQRQVRVSDRIARWGGTEFVLMLSDTHATLARGGLERLTGRVAALRVVHEAVSVSVTVSGGLAEHHAGATVEQTLERAERALQEAKSQGRNRVVVAA